ncbi:hypothetical protein Syun_023276 [Stephania yunnanensis]|uniref:Uncharacterized protein n=1 Tax=Stephania yunnanensis TaxID=152371 RepID=A0AAP0I3D4_9MAGN
MRASLELLSSWSRCSLYGSLLAGHLRHCHGSRRHSSCWFVPSATWWTVSPLIVLPTAAPPSRPLLLLAVRAFASSAAAAARLAGL